MDRGGRLRPGLGWGWGGAPYLLAAAAASLYIVFSVHQWNNFVVPSWDLGIFTQLAQQYAHLSAPIVDIKGPGYNLWGDHFHPILVLLGPVFRLFPSGLTLLVVQNLLFAWSSVPITRLAIERLGRLPGLLLGVSYVLSWGLTGAVAAQFHEIAFAVPLLAFGLVAWLEGRLRAAALFMGLLVFVKEDLGLTVLIFGVVVVLSRRTGWSVDSLRHLLRDRTARVGAVLALWGAFWFAAAIWVILPAFSESGAWEYTDNVEQARGVLGFLTGLVTPGQKLVTLLLLVLAAGVVGLASPLMWLMLPTLAWRFAGSVEAYWGWDWHYSAVLMPIAALSLIDGVQRCASRWPARPWGRVAVAVSLAGSLAMAYSGPMGGLVRGTAPTMDPAAREAAQGALRAVPSGSAVVTDLTLLAYLVPGNTVFWEGTVGSGGVDVVAVSPQTQVVPEDMSVDEWASLQFGGEWTPLFSEEGYRVAKRVG